MAPEDREWSATNSNESTTYNRKLFASGDKSSKKFGRHLATIKYSLLLAPFYVSHIYKHKDREDYTKDVVGATGLKLRLESFVLDLHQRREEVASQGKGRLKLTRSSGMRINKAQLDFLSADIRAVSALIKGTAAEDLQRATDEELASYDDKSFMPSDVKHFNIPDNATVWIDMDDFVELDWILPAETHPETRIMPLAFAPRFTYIRQTDHVKDDFQDSERSSPFGEESTHICMMTTDNDPQRVQQHLIERRISVLREKLDSHERLITELEARFRGQQSRDLKLEEQRRILQEQREMIGQKISFMQSILKRILQHLQSTWNCRGSLSTGSSTPDVGPTVQTSEFDDLPNALQPLSLANDFNNCFIIHNIHLKWNNSLRNIILRYVHQVSQRRGFVYYMSRRAVRFILDIVEEQQRHKNKAYTYAPGQTTTAESSSSASFKDQTEDVGLEERIQELLNDGKNLVAADDPKPYASSRQGSGVIKEDLSEEYTAHNSYHVRLIAPQIQLQSDKNSRSVLLVTGREMQLKIVQIMDRSRLADDVSGLVQRRFSVDMDGIQFFVTNRKTINKFLHLHSAERYGSPKNSAWPPWAPVEVNFDFRLNPIGWSRVVQKTSASLRYDKYNTLRLKYNDEVNKSDPQRSSVAEDIESRIDHLWVEFPHIRAICDSTQYYAMYVIVLDLLFYSEPLEKTRTERLEKIMLAADFSDLSGAPGMVTSLQDRVRQLEEIKSHFQLHAKHLDRHGWQDRLAIERDLTSCEDELFFIMKAITTSQRKYDDRTPDSQSNGLLRWNLSASEIVWHLMRENDEPLVEIRLQHASYHRTDNSDGSNHNDMEIERIHGLNLLPDASYPEMIAPYFESSISETEKQQSMKMFRVHWVMLEAIAGIPILDQFEVNLFPLRVQLEREVGKKLFEYIFPGNGTPNDVSPFLLEQTLPLQASNDSDNEDDRDEDDTRFLDIPHKADFDKPRTSTRAGSLELRLRPTITLPSPPVPTNSGSIKAKQSYSSLITAGSSQDRFTQSAAVSTVSLGPHSSISLPNSRKRSNSNLLAWDRPPHEASSANVSIATSSSEPSRKLNPQRTNSGLNKEKLHPPDDITEMMSRASNYMTLAYAKVPSVVLCLSYKGRAERNIEDVHNFVFRMPTLEYRNKTWSNLDLALRLKKDVVKALISHTGAIIGNKFQHHRPTKHQQSRPREAATSLSLLSNTDNLNSFVRSSTTASDDAPGRERQMVPSSSAFIAGWGSQTIRTSSSTTSLDSMISPGNTTTFDSPGRNYRRV
ncbi:MAG: hypothetical protein LQ340_006022 [Diploschistes diacapsis]|nr:MAG: hypothetical protein LQ340_006022 [Diploschistes diacapsis]